MIDIDQLPLNGILLIQVFFKGYKDSYQNDSRRKLLEAVPKQALKVELELEPITFCLIRSIVSGVGRSIGAEYQYRVIDMNENKYRSFLSEMTKICERTSIWADFEILICDYVGVGINE